MEITASGETRTAVDALILNSNKVHYIPIGITDLGFSDDCLDLLDVREIAFVANSNDGIHFVNVGIFISVREHDVPGRVDGNGGANRLRVTVFP